jgi:NRPS condensation-like uncharacterized protein
MDDSWEGEAKPISLEDFKRAAKRADELFEYAKAHGWTIDDLAWAAQLLFAYTLSHLEPRQRPLVLMSVALLADLFERKEESS